MPWNLRYAAHLGYRPPFDPLFVHSARSADLLAQIDFAAELGLAGMLCASARNWPAARQTAVGEALARHGLEAGCLLYTPFDTLRVPFWGQSSEAARDFIDEELGHAIQAAHRLGATRLAVLGGADPQQPLALQQAAMVEHLKRAGDQAARGGVVLCLETINRHSVPDMLLHHMADAHAVVRAVDHPAVRLIFDTAHVQAMDGHLVENLEAVWDDVEVVQVADHPGRTQPGSAEIDFEAFWRALARRDWRGLVELEHGWDVPGLDSEQRGIATLRRLDALASSAR